MPSNPRHSDSRSPFASGGPGPPAWAMGNPCPLGGSSRTTCFLMPQTDFPLCPPMSAPVYHAAFPPTRCLPSARRPSVMHPLSEASRPGVEESACSTLPGDEKRVLISLQEWRGERRNINLLSWPSRGSCSGGGSHTFILAPNARRCIRSSVSSRPPRGSTQCPCSPGRGPSQQLELSLVPLEGGQCPG